jgi:hypothetical protein
MLSPIRLLTGGATHDLTPAYVIFGGLNWLTLSMAAWSFSVLANRVRQCAGPRRVRRVVIVWSSILVVFLLVVAIRLIQVYAAPRAAVPLFLAQFPVQLVLTGAALITSSWLARRARVSTHGSGDVG